jgi:Mrp family chromosome partitioning ATPase
MLAEMRRMASCVIIDTPPVGEVSEALRIAPICDEVLFVARPRHTDRRRLILARELLERADAQMAGMVLIGRETGLPGASYGYGYSTNFNGVVDEQSQRSVSPTRSKSGRDVRAR